MSQFFHRTEKRWLLTEQDATTLEYALRELAWGEPYTVESVYLKVSKRVRVRLRRYLVDRDQEKEERFRLKTEKGTPPPLSTNPPETGAGIRNIQADGIRIEYVADYIRSWGSIRELDPGRIARWLHSPSRRCRGKGQPPKVGTSSTGKPGQEIQQEPLVHGK